MNTYTTGYTDTYMKPRTDYNQVNYLLASQGRLNNQNLPPNSIVQFTTAGKYRLSNGLTRGENLGWANPHGISIPLLNYNPACRKCHGTGAKKGLLSSSAYPCKKCYSEQGYCRKCFGSGINYKRNKPCGCGEGLRYRGGNTNLIATGQPVYVVGQSNLSSTQQTNVVRKRSSSSSSSSSDDERRRR